MRRVAPRWFHLTLSDEMRDNMSWWGKVRCWWWLRRTERTIRKVLEKEGYDKAT